MSFKHTPIIQVYFLSTGSGKRLMGRLALKERKIFFEYSAEFLQSGFELSPFKLPLKPGVIACEDPLFEGLFGVFNDSLPDGWGRLLLDRKLQSLGINPGELSPLDRLRYVGSRGMGALAYEPEVEGIRLPDLDDLDKIADEAIQFQDNEDEQFVDDLLAMNGSSAGARPKIVIHRDEQDWIIKFRSSLDPKDSGPVEYAYHLMAVAANLNVPKAKLYQSKKGPGYFGVQRFDRIQDRRIHMHTVSGLLHVDHRIPSLDYETIMKATIWLTKDARECEKQFRAAVFNVLAHNRDDHAKNFSFLMDEKGGWQVSPAYDLTFSTGPAGEHCSTIMSEGRNPTLSHLLKLAQVGCLKEASAIKIIEEVNTAVSKWDSFAKQADVSKKSHSLIQTALLRVRNDFFR